MTMYDVFFWLSTEDQNESAVDQLSGLELQCGGVVREDLNDVWLWLDRSCLFRSQIC